MNTIDKENSSDGQLSEDIELISINLNAATKNHSRQDGTEKNWQDLATSGNMPATEKNETESLTGEQIIELEPAVSGPGNHQNEQIEGNRNQNNMYTHIDHKPVRNELNDIDSASIVQSV